MMTVYPLLTVGLSQVDSNMTAPHEVTTDALCHNDVPTEILPSQDDHTNGDEHKVVKTT